MKNIRPKPIFVMYHKINPNSNNMNKDYHDIRSYLETTLTEYNVIVVPIYESITYSQAFYPSEFKEEKIENFIEEVAKKSAFKNIRIKFDKE